VSGLVHVMTEKEQVGDSYSYPVLRKYGSIILVTRSRCQVYRGLTAEVHVYFEAKYGYAKVLYKSTSHN